MLSSGDVVLVDAGFVDMFEKKRRPAVVLYSEFGNVVLAGITSNRNMVGVELLKSDGAVSDSVIKLNYVFTIAEELIVKKLFSLSASKRKELYSSFVDKLNALSF